MGSDNLPDNVSESATTAPWNLSNSPWDTGVLEESSFECDHCGFSMTGIQLVHIGWDEPTVVLSGRPVHECPACVMDAVHGVGSKPFTEETKIGLLVMPHICGVTDTNCTCDADDRADNQLEQEREETYV